MLKLYYFLKTVFRIFIYLFSNTKRYSNILLLILLHRPKSILEVGVYRGKRSKEMIEAAKIFNNKIYFYGFDLFEMFNKSILKKELSKTPGNKKEIYKELSTIADVKLFSGYTFKTLPIINEKVDFIFIDGGHSIKTIYSDWKHCSKLMKKRSILIFDDYYLNNKNIIENFGCNKIVSKISNNIYKKKIHNLTDNFFVNNNLLKIKIVSIFKK